MKGPVPLARNAGRLGETAGDIELHGTVRRASTTCAAILLGLLSGVTWLFRAAVWLQGLVAAESTAITLRLREPPSDVTSFAHARALAEREKGTGDGD